MNGMLIQLVASATALSIMGGAVTVHYVHVREATASADDMAVPEGLELASSERIVGIPDEARGSDRTEDFEREQAEISPKDEMMLSVMQGFVERIEALSDETRQLKEENLALAEQVAEANRDLSQLQFQVDTHSESFRPLRLGEDTRFRRYESPANSVLPPKDWGGGSQAGVQTWRNQGQ